MRTSIWTRRIVTALAGCGVAVLAAPAMGQSDDLTLRRDGSKAVPFVAEVSKASGASSSHPAMRRDGSAAVPFVADLNPETPAAADGFDWRDAGVGIATVVVMLAAARALHAPGPRPLRAQRSGNPTASG